MNTIDQIKAVVANYATALNSGDAGLLASLYTDDCLFKAKHYQPVVKKEDIQTRASRFFLTKKFTIQIVITDIQVRDNIALVKASGSSRTNQDNMDYTNDFFILLLEDGQWKVFSYFIYAI